MHITPPTCQGRKLVDSLISKALNRHELHLFKFLYGYFPKQPKQHLVKFLLYYFPRKHFQQDKMSATVLEDMIPNTGNTFELDEAVLHSKVLVLLLEVAINRRWF
jgi:hypothetical protein